MRVAELVADPTRPADARVTLVARQQTFSVGPQHLAGYTLNGRSPGPLIEATQGDLVEVRLHNASVAGGVTLHWHGIDVPNAMDGVAGVTQDAVPVGGEYTYRFIADRAGTFWYHSHQVSDTQVMRGLFGPVLIHPKSPDRSSTGRVHDVIALDHTYDGSRTLNGSLGDVHVMAARGSTVRVRVIKLRQRAGQRLDVRAVPSGGGRRHRPARTDADQRPVRHRHRRRPGGSRGGGADHRPGRAVQVGATTAVVIGPDATTAIVAVPAQPDQPLDLLSYGTPAPLGFDPAKADRHFYYSIGRRPGFVGGRPGLYWSINGHLYPDVPMFLVREGDIVTMHIENHSDEVHPMHLHGHHAVVLDRKGVAASGSPWWVDSLNVQNHESYDIALVADNPGIWMDHCHNLAHAAQGMVAHLMYEGVTTPYRIGGLAGNDPE